MTRTCQLALCVVLATAAFGAPSTPAQTATGTLAGIARDSSGGVMPGVSMKARNVATGVSRNATSDSEGRYRIPNIDPGEYEVRAELSGFRTTVNRGVMVTVGGTTEADVAMTVGQIAEEVTVATEPPLIEPAKTELSRVVSSRGRSSRCRSAAGTSSTS